MANHFPSSKVWHRGLISILEPRLMYDGAAGVAAVEVVEASDSAETESTESQMTELIPAVTEDSSSENSTDPSAEDVTAAAEALESGEENPVASDSEETMQEVAEDQPEDEGTEIAFIDASVDDAETLASEIDPSTETYYLDSDSSGVTQIEEILAEKESVDAIHIFSHGTTGNITLGEDHITTENVDVISDALGNIGQALSENGDILIYGCNIGQDTNLVNQLAELTGADVAASDDATGPESMGGDWDLEVESGNIEHSGQVASSYNHLLGTPVIANGNSDFEDGLSGWTTNGTVEVHDSVTLTPTGKTWVHDSTGTGMAVLYPSGGSTEFNTDIESTLGISTASKDYISDTFYSNSSKRPTNFASITNTFTALAGDSFTVSWNYTSMDYVPYNDGSMLSVVNTGSPSDVAVLDGVKAEVLILGATNAGTGNYTTGSYGSTGWQTSTVKILTGGTYTIGFSTFNLGDTALNPYLFVDDIAGTSTLNGENFDPIDPDENAPPPAGEVVGDNATLATEAEDSTPSGDTVSNLFTSFYAGTLDGVAVSVDNSISSEGRWQYSTDNGSNWYNIGTVSTDSALLLGASSKLRFLPSADWSGEPGTLTAHMVDSSFSDTFTSGATRQSFDTTADDGTVVTDGTTDLETTISAVNDAPEITNGPASVVFTETNAALSQSGTFTVTDVDTSDVVTSTVSSVSASGNSGELSNAFLKSMLSVDPAATLDGSTQSATLTWTFNSGSEPFDFLNEGESLSLVYTVTSIDNNGSPLSDTETVTVTINGTNDVPLITNGPDTAEVNETDSSVTASGSLTVTDLDTSDTVTASVESLVVTGSSNRSDALAPTDNELKAMLSVSPAAVINGSTVEGSLTWNFNSSSEYFNYLATGESLVLTYTVKAIEDNGTLASDTETVTITITGTDDDPTISATASNGVVVEPGDASAVDIADVGTVSFDDIDTSDTIDITFASNDDISWSGGTIDPTLAALLVGGFTTGTSNATTPGTTPWTYNVEDADLDFLAKDETITFSYAITADDGNGGTANATVSFTITGTNDTPSVSADNGSIIENGDAASQDLTETGTVTFDDIDTNDVIDITFASNDDIVWSGGTIDSALAAQLVAGFTTGVEDAAAPGTTPWNYAVSGVDLDFLAGSETITFSYDVTATDNNGGSNTTTVTISITATNDTPDISVLDGDSAESSLIETNDALNDSGSLSVRDHDLSDTVTMSHAVSGVQLDGDGNPMAVDATQPDNAALLSMLSYTQQPIDGSNQTGTIDWTFNSDTVSFDYLALGEQLVLTYTLTADDGRGASDTQELVVTITGTNDLPTLDVDTSNPIIETQQGSGMNLTDSGKVSFTDIDTTDVVKVSFVNNSDIVWSGGALDTSLAAQLLAGFSASASNRDAPGSTPWTYNATGVNLDFLSAGETITFSYTVTVTDVNGATDKDTIAFLITGTNDGPTATSITSPDNAQENEPFSYSVHRSVFNDVDQNDNLRFSASGLPGGLSFTAGTLTVSGVPTQAGTFTITVKATDKTGSTATSSFILVVDPAPIAVTPEPIPVDPLPPVDNPQPDPVLPESIPVFPPPGANPPVDTTVGGDSGTPVGDINTKLPLADDGGGNDYSPFEAPPGELFDSSSTESLSGEGEAGEVNLDFQSEVEGSQDASAVPEVGESVVGDGEVVSDGKSGEQQKDGKNVLIGQEVVRVDDTGQVIYENQSKADSGISLSIESLNMNQATGELEIQFHSNSGSEVSTFTATLSNGAALPVWLDFDPVTGKISGQVPEGTEEIELKIEMTNGNGDTEILMLMLHLDTGQSQSDVSAPDSPESKVGLLPLSMQMEALSTSAEQGISDIWQALA